MLPDSTILESTHESTADWQSHIDVVPGHIREREMLVYYSMHTATA